MKYIILICIIALLITGCAKTIVNEDEAIVNDDNIVDEEEQTMCTMETKLCPDGTTVSRNPDNDCTFNECPATQNCDANTKCPDGYECWSVQGEDKPICILGSGENICTTVCGSPACDVAESYPPQVFCE